MNADSLAYLCFLIVQSACRATVAVNIKLSIFRLLPMNYLNLFGSLVSRQLSGDKLVMYASFIRLTKHTFLLFK